MRPRKSGARLPRGSPGSSSRVESPHTRRAGLPRFSGALALTFRLRYCWLSPRSTNPMAILVTLPVTVYDGLLNKCSALSREYVILKNGVVRRDLDGGSDAVVEVL